jgi:DNA polymerase III epsilon subunit-like protein
MGRAGISVLKFIIPDVETTGRNAYNHKIVEVAAIVLNQDLVEIERWGTLVNPGREALAKADPEAMAVNRLTAEALQDAPRLQEAAEGFQALVDRHRGATLHSFNNHFDSQFLRQDPWNTPINRWGDCIMLASMEIMEAEGALEVRENGTCKYPKLTEAIAFFGLKSETSHRAIVDARAAADVFIEIQRRHRSCPDDTEHEQETRYFLREGL